MPGTQETTCCEDAYTLKVSLFRGIAFASHSPTTSFFSHSIGYDVISSLLSEHAEMEAMTSANRIFVLIIVINPLADEIN